jgi:N12 class adenine-specific DNA methylase
MDAFDQEERRLTQGQIDGTEALDPGATLTRGTGETSVTELGQSPPTAAPLAHGGRSLVISNPPEGGPVTSRFGGDPFEQEEARQRLQTGIAAGGDVTSQLRRSVRMGHDAADAEEQQFFKDDNARGNAFVDAVNDGNNSTTLNQGIGTQASTGATPQRVTHEQWAELRKEWQLNHPTDPLPPELQVFQLGLRGFEAGQRGRQDILNYALHNRDTDLLHDEGMQEEARKRWDRPGALPVELQGTKEQRDQAARSGLVESLRAKYPAAADLPDDQLVQFEATQQEEQSKRLIVAAVRKQLAGRDATFMEKLGGAADVAGVGGKDLGDDQVLALVQAAPEAVAWALHEAAMPGALEAAKKREQDRQTVGSVEGDSTELREFDRHALFAEKAKRAGSKLADTKIIPGVANMGDLAALIHSADLGLPGLVAKGLGQGENYDAAMQGYAADSPFSHFVYSTAGYFVPGSPAWFLGKGMGKVIGTPLKDAIASTAGQTTIKGAWRAALSKAPAEAFEKAPWLSRVGATSLAAGVEMPFYNAISAAVDGDAKGAAKAFNYGDPQTRLSAAMGMVLGPLLSEGPRGLALGAKNIITDFSYRRGGGKALDAELASLGIEITDRASVNRVRSFVAEMERGAGVTEAAAKSKVTGADLMDAMRLAAAVRQARARSARSGSAGVDGTASAGPTAERGSNNGAPKPPRGGGSTAEESGPNNEIVKQGASSGLKTPETGAGPAPEAAAAAGARSSTRNDAETPAVGEGGQKVAEAHAKLEQLEALKKGATPEEQKALEAAQQEVLHTIVNSSATADTPAAEAPRASESPIEPAEGPDAGDVASSAAEAGHATTSESGRGVDNHPAELADAEALGKWYGETFNDPSGAPAIQALGSMNDGKFVLADVPVDQVRMPVVTAGDKDPGKIDAISQLDEGVRAALPPAIFTGGRRGKLDVADGAHRLGGAQAAGAKTIRAYVPESTVGKNGITRAGSAETETAAGGGGAQAPIPKTPRPHAGRGVDNSGTPGKPAGEEGAASTEVDPSNVQRKNNLDQRRPAGANVQSVARVAGARTGYRPPFELSTFEGADGTHGFRLVYEFERMDGMHDAPGFTSAEGARAAGLAHARNLLKSILKDPATSGGRRSDAEKALRAIDRADPAGKGAEVPTPAKKLGKPAHDELAPDDFKAAEKTYSADRLAYQPKGKLAILRGTFEHGGKTYVAVSLSHDQIGASEVLPWETPEDVARPAKLPRGGPVMVSNETITIYKQGGDRRTVAERAADEDEAREAITTSAEGPWDFQSSFPKIVLDPNDPDHLDALARHGLQYDEEKGFLTDDGEHDVEAALTEGVMQELGSYRRTRDRGRALAAAGVDEGGKPLSEQNLKGVKGVAEDAQQSIDQLLSIYTDLFGEKAADALRGHIEAGAAEEAVPEPLSKSDASLHHALHHVANAAERWAELQEAGATDEQLRAAIAREFGIDAGFSGPGEPGWRSKGGTNPRFWLGSGDGKPTLKGTELLRAVRRLLHIGLPTKGGTDASVTQTHDEGHGQEAAGGKEAGGSEEGQEVTRPATAAAGDGGRRRRPSPYPGLEKDQHTELTTLIGQHADAAVILRKNRNPLTGAELNERQQSDALVEAERLRSRVEDLLDALGDAPLNRAAIAKHYGWDQPRPTPAATPGAAPEYGQKLIYTDPAGVEHPAEGRGAGEAPGTTRIVTGGTTAQVPTPNVRPAEGFSPTHKTALLGEPVEIKPNPALPGTQIATTADGSQRVIQTGDADPIFVPPTPEEVATLPTDAQRGQNAGAAGQPVVAGAAEVPAGERPAGAAAAADGGAAEATDGAGASADGAPAADLRPGDAGVRPAGGRGARGAAGGDGADPARPDRAVVRAGERDAGAAADADAGAADGVGDVDRQPPADPSSLNHRIEAGDVIAPLGEMAKTDANIRAIKLLKTLEAEGRNATPAEKKVLAQYVGWGGLPLALDETKAEKREHANRGWLHGDELTNFQNWQKKWGKRYDQIRELLSDEEFQAAARSTINAHYTSRDVVGAMWDLAKALGFKGGSVLENSAGVGNFMGLQPAELARRTRWTAVERDSISGRILKKLYPQAQVLNEDFSKSRILPNTQDLNIGNVPFDRDGPRDDRYPKFSLHNYFLARSIDLNKPGAVTIEITSSSTLDSPASLKAREWIAERADLVWAVRLPNDAFKTNAGTEVVTDILVFRKKDGGAFPHANAFRSVFDMPTHDGKGTVAVNEYFHQHPENLLGLVSLDGKMRRDNEPTLLPFPEKDLKDLLAAAVKRIPGKIFNTSSAELLAALTPTAAADAMKENSLQLAEGGGVRQVRGRLLLPPEWANHKNADSMNKRAAAWMPLRDATKELFRLQQDPDATPAAIDNAQKNLTKLYDGFAQKWGPISGRANAFLQVDPEYPVTTSLEFIEPQIQQVKTKGGGVEEKFVNTVRKADIFTKRTQWPRVAPTSAENVGDAIAISLSWRGTLDLPYVAGLVGKTPDQAADDALARNLVYRDPDSGLLATPEAYLSGDVRAKLIRARRAADEDPQYARNVTALEVVQPPPLKMADISVRLGSTWVPPVVIKDWISALFEGHAGGVEVFYSPEVGRWGIQWGYQLAQSAANRNLYAGGGLPATELIEDALNLKGSVAYDTVQDEGGRKRDVKNADRTIAAQAAQEKLKEHFVRWVTGSKHVPTLEKLYNETFNNTVLRKFPVPGFTHYPGAADVVTLRPHQMAAVTRGTVESYLLAHAVGTGKTYTFITTAMEWRRLGLAKKPMIVAQNATVEQIVESFKRLYPWANVLTPTEADFDSKNRKRLLSRIATGAYDAVVVAHSQFELLPDDPERVRTYVQERTEELEDALRSRQATMSQAEWKRDPTVKEIQKAIERLQKKLDELTERKTDDTLTFEQLGVDGLIVDEAHRYKKLEFTSQMDNIKGLDRGYSQRGFGLYMKTRYIQERNAGRGVILATGTPITNTLAEAWTMLRYVRPDLLRAHHIEKFDDFASLFTQPVTAPEMTAMGLKMETRLVEFTNADELVKLFRSAADVINPEEVDLPRPGLKGGKPSLIDVEAAPTTRAYLSMLIDRYRAWTKLSGKEKREQSHVPLVITGLARRAALDLRLVDAGAADEPGSKLNRAVQEMLRIYKESTPWSGTQIVFAESYKNTGEGVGEDGEAIGDFNLWRDLKDKLIAGGVPADEIQNIYDHDSKKARPLLFDQVNQGKVRFLFGSTDKLGVGVNVQALLTALHHLDAPWRPSDIEQREGRILRQGNRLLDMGREVEIYRYGTKNSLDAGMWAKLAMKQKFINQLLRGQLRGRTHKDPGAETVIAFEEAAALISGDPLAIERITTDARVRQLSAMRLQHEHSVIEARQRARAMREHVPEATREAQQYRQVLKELVPKLAADPIVLTDLHGKELARGAEANKLLDEIATKALAKVRAHAFTTYSVNPIRQEIGTYLINGVPFHLKALQNMSGDSGKPMGDPDVEYDIEWAARNSNKSLASHVGTGSGVLRSARSIVGNRLETWAAAAEAFLKKAEREIPPLEQFSQQPFAEEAEYQEKKGRLESIDAEMQASAMPQQQQPTQPAPPASDDLLDGGLDRQGPPDRPTMGPRDGLNRPGFVLNPFALMFPPDEPSKHGFGDKKIEERFRVAQRGQQDGPLRERIRAWAEQTWAKFSRPFEHMPVGARFAEAKRILLYLEKQKGVRQHDAVKALDQVLKGIDADRYDLFGRKVILDDLHEEVTRQTDRGIDRDEVRLPFGFTADAVDTELGRIAPKIVADATTSTALSRRAVLWESVKREYSQAMKAIGFDAGKKLDRASYYRHQVLAYAQARATSGTGTRLRTPTGRSFLKFRAGSELDINADYLQAEFEVLGQMMFDTQVARAIAQIRSFYDVTPQLKKQAAAHNYAETIKSLQIMATLQATTPEALYRKLYNWKQAKGFNDLFYAASIGDLPDNANNDYDDLLQAMADVFDLRDTGKDPDAKLTPAMMRKLWSYSKYLMSLPDGTADAGKMAFGLIFKGRAEKKKNIKSLLGNDHQEWQDLIPDGFELWQPRPGTQFYLADSIPARMANDLLQGVLTEIIVKPEHVKKVMAKAQPFPGIVIPSELAATLERLFEPPSDEWLAKGSATLLNTWKQYILMNPRRFTKFNIRNASGDADAAIAFNPDAFRFVPQAARELWQVLQQNKPMGAAFRQWFERGGMQSTLQVQEIPDINGLDVFRRFDPRKGLTPLAKRAWRFWWKKAEGASNFREAVLRYANFLSFTEQMKQGGGRPKTFGASIPEEVMALRDVADRAFLLSNEVSGAYDSIGSAGKVIRRHWYPFWSFVESNFKRYFRGMKNAARDGETAHTIGRLLLRKAATPGVYVKVGRFVLKAAALWTAMVVWNWLFFRKEEESLDPKVRARPHIIFGTDKDGKVIYFDRLGALQDVLDWFGADEIPEHVRQWLNGRRTLGEVAEDLALSPAKKLVTGFNPFWKLPTELLTGKQLFPDPTQPRTIRDRADYLARQLSIEHEFRALTDRPARPYWQSWADLGIYRSDPDGAAYYDLLDKKAQFLKKVGKGGGGDFNSPRTEALRQYKLAVRLDDKKAAAQALTEYKMLGGTREGLRDSLAAMDPLAGMSTREARAFVQWLNEEERQRIPQARRYYVRVLLGADADAAGRPATD